MIKKYFPEYSDMAEYIRANQIKKWEYRFTFAYGYELFILEG